MKPLGPTAKRRAAKARAKAAHYRTVCRAVDIRDCQCCRVCGCRLLRGAHHHHILPRSLGGKDTTANLVMLCPLCHRDIHDRRFTLTGNGDGEVFTQPGTEEGL